MDLRAPHLALVKEMSLVGKVLPLCQQVGSPFMLQIRVLSDTAQEALSIQFALNC